MMVGFSSSPSSWEAVDSVRMLISVSESEEESIKRGEEGAFASFVGVGRFFVALEVERGVAGFSFLNKELIFHASN